MTLHYTYTVIYTEIYENNYILYTVYLYTHAVYHFDGEAWLRSCFQLTQWRWGDLGIQGVGSVGKPRKTMAKPWETHRKPKESGDWTQKNGDLMGFIADLW
jgi:hypothetical protein